MDYARFRAVAENLAQHTPDTVRGFEISGDEIVMQLSSSNHTSDGVDKVHDYSATDIAHYLLVDPRTSTPAVLTDPGSGPDGSGRRARHDCVFGDPITIGPWSLSTSGLRPYPTTT